MKNKSIAVQMALKSIPEILTGFEFQYNDFNNDNLSSNEFLLCGTLLNSSCAIISYRSDENIKGIVLDPIYIRKPEYKNKLFFDHTIHGYNGVFDISTSEKNDSTQLKEYKCTNCSYNQFKLNVFLIYEIWDDEIYEDDEIKKMISNAFTGLSLSAICCKCKKEDIVCDFECA